MVSASAVTAVRPGLRMALRRASEPAAPPTAADGRPTRLASPRTPRANSPGVAACALSRSAATGAIFVARRAGIIAASTVASVPTSRLTTIVRVATHHPVRGQLRADRGEQGVQALREHDADADAGGGREQADRQRLQQHRAAHLAAGGADHPQQPELLRALGDGDRERVEDRERADEHGDGREREQDRAQDAHERVEGAEREPVILGRGPNFRVRTGRAGDVGAAAGDEDAVVAILGEQRPCCLQVEDGGAGLAERLHAREVGDAGERERLRLTARGDLDLCRRPRSADSLRSRGRSRPRPGRRPSGRRAGGTGSSRSAPGGLRVEADTEVRARADRLAASWPSPARCR